MGTRFVRITPERAMPRAAINVALVVKVSGDTWWRRFGLRTGYWAPVVDHGRK